MKNLKGKKLSIFLVFLSLLMFNLTPSKTMAFPGELKIIADSRVYDFYYPQIDYTKNGFVLRGKEDIARRICDDAVVEPLPARLIFTPDGEKPFVILKEKSGKKIDFDYLIKQIDFALESGKRVIKIKSLPSKSPITVEDVKNQTFLRGCFSTDYSSSSPSRKHNIQLASSFINGKIIMPSEEFSFNETVGKRTKDRGFMDATIISDGDFIKGTGGGVCQVSTTLYNAFLKAGLNVTESHRHSLSVSYVKPSFDAMVSYGYCDLKFKNTTNCPLYIGLSTKNSVITAKIYGIKNEFEYHLVSDIKGYIEPKVKVIKRENADGKNQNKKGKRGIKSEGYLHIYQNGILLEVRKIREDIYKPVDEIRVED